MSYIKSLSLKNFRSWKDGFVEFDPGVNVIAGSNDSGKSNILRAINWIVNNQPTGWNAEGKEKEYEGIRSWWGGDTEIKINIDDKEVKRFRSDSKNQYFLSGTKEPFEGFGIKAPTTISEFLNFSDINITFQLNGPFLLSKSAPDVARYYNGLINLDIIDRSISSINGVLKKQKDSLKIQEKIKEEKDIQLKQFEWVDEAEIKLINLEKKESELVRKNSEFSKLSYQIKSLKDLQNELSNKEKIIIHEDKLNNILSLTDKIKSTKSSIDQLRYFASLLKTLKEKQYKLNKILKYEDKVKDLIKLNSDIENKTTQHYKLDDFINNIKILKDSYKIVQGIIKHESKVNSLVQEDKIIENKTNQYNGLLDMVNYLKELNDKLSQIIKNKKDLEDKFNILMPSICPLCGK